MNGKIYEVVKASWKTDKTRQDKIKNWNRKIEAALEREGEKKGTLYKKEEKAKDQEREISVWNTKTSLPTDSILIGWFWSALFTSNVSV